MKTDTEIRTEILLKAIDKLNIVLDNVRPVLEQLVELGTIDGFDELDVIQKIQIATSFVISIVHKNDPESKEFI